MIINVCGFGNSGASAVIDYLKGYNALTVFDDYEFQLLHQIDGIGDLKYYLTTGKDRIACNGAIHRFLKCQKKGNFGAALKTILGKKYYEWAENLVDDLCVAKWHGNKSSFDPIEILKPKSTRLARYLANKLCRKRKIKKYFSILDSDAFDRIVKKRIDELFAMLFGGGKDVVLDMLFSVTNPLSGMEYFDDCKSIVVTRDPRDVYVTSKLHDEDSRFMPNDDVNKFVDYYKTLVNCFLSISDQRLLIIRYEDLIYDYFKTTEKIRLFLGMPSLPDNEFRYFNPAYSQKFTNRVQLYKKHESDVTIIKERLCDFLYDFDSALSPSNDPKLQLLLSEKAPMYEGLRQN